MIEFLMWCAPTEDVSRADDSKIARVAEVRRWFFE